MELLLLDYNDYLIFKENIFSIFFQNKPFITEQILFTIIVDD